LTNNGQIAHPPNLIDSVLGDIILIATPNLKLPHLIINLSKKQILYMLIMNMQRIVKVDVLQQEACLLSELQKETWQNEMEQDA
jgi:hypothetical protein